LVATLCPPGLKLDSTPGHILEIHGMPCAIGQRQFRADDGPEGMTATISILLIGGVGNFNGHNNWAHQNLNPD
jgi:hypothetical protein